MKTNKSGNVIYYLYVKTHNITGLKYLGYTKKDDVHAYPDSGKYWRRHLDVHGYNYSTEILVKTTCDEELRSYGVYFSKKWNVAESNKWANLKEENGIDGGRLSEDTCRKISNALKGKIRSDEHCHNISESRKGIEPANKGRKMLELNSNYENSFKGKIHSEESRQQMSSAKKGKVPWNKGKIGVQTAWNKGKTGIYSEETLISMSNSHKNISDETRNRLSVPAKNRWDKKDSTE